LIVSSSAVSEFAGAISGGNGSLVKDGTGSQTLSGANTYTGSTTVTAGSLQVTGSHVGGGNYAVGAGATLGGTGLIDPGGSAAVNVAGVLSPGLAGDVGVLSVGSPASPNAVVVQSGGALDLQLAPSGVSDRLTVKGALNLSAAGDELRLSTSAGALDGSAYTLASFTAGSLTGMFDEIFLDDVLLSGPEALQVLGYQLVYNNPAGLVQLSPSLIPGDFNGDTFVDGDDLIAWESGFGMTSGAEIGDGDANGDDAVDGTDFLAWQRNLGGGPGATAAAAPVPEPAAAALLLLGAVCAGALRMGALGMRTGAKELANASAS
jgi:autotransporter-associated beta strand protein